MSTKTNDVFAEKFYQAEESDPKFRSFLESKFMEDYGGVKDDFELGYEGYLENMYLETMVDLEEEYMRTLPQPEMWTNPLTKWFNKKF